MFIPTPQCSHIHMLHDSANEGCEVNSTELTWESMLGSGRTAEVFIGEWRGLQVAIKQITGPAWMRKKMGLAEQESFDRELAIMHKTDHVNLVKMLGFVSREEPFVIVMELCAGGSCWELLHKCDHIELNWDQKLKMGVDVASAMEYLHGCHPQIIHRDLKSGNLLLSKSIWSENDTPLVKVSDFGMARMKLYEEDWDGMTQEAGTCHWMAPEVFAGTCYDEKVDVYSFAMVLFEIICREVPFEEQAPENVGVMIAAGQRPDLEAVPPDTPPVLKDLMIACWAQDPKMRPCFKVIKLQLEGIAKVSWPNEREFLL